MKTTHLFLSLLLLSAATLLAQNSEPSLTLDSPKNGATNISVLPTFEWTFSEVPKTPVLIQILSQGQVVFTATIQHMAKKHRYKLLEAGVAGGGLISIAGRLEPKTTYHWKVMLAMTHQTASFTTGEIKENIENPMLKALLQNLKAPYKIGNLGEKLKVGQWTEYQNKASHTSTKMKMALVGQDEVGNWWYEMTTQTPQFSYILKLLVDTSEDHLVIKAYAGSPKGKAVKIPIMSEQPSLKENKDFKTEEQDLGEKRITIPLGDFDCVAKLYRVAKLDGSYKVDTVTYTSKKIPLSGMVKTMTKGIAGGRMFSAETDLIGQGEDAVSELNTN